MTPSLHQVGPRASPVPAFLLSLVAHVLLVLLVPWSGQAVFAPPTPGPAPFEFVEVGQIGMPGSGTDPLSGPAGEKGGSPFGTVGGPPAPEGVDPLVTIPRSAVDWLEWYEATHPDAEVPPPETWHLHSPATPGLQAPPTGAGATEAPPSELELDVPVVEGIGHGVPMPVPTPARTPAEGGAAEPTDSAYDDRSAAIRAMMLRALLDGGAEVVDTPIGLGSPSGEGGPGPFSGAGSRFGTVPDPELLLWQRLVKRQLMERFRPLPVVRANPELTTTVVLTLGPAGAVLSHEVRQSSGNARFDAAARVAIDSGPLPPPPAHWAEVLRVEGLVVRFTPSGP